MSLYSSIASMQGDSIERRVNALNPYASSEFGADPLITGRYVQQGQVCNFNGVNEFVALSVLGNTGSVITWAAWVRVDSDTGALQCVHSTSKSGNANHYYAFGVRPVSGTMRVSLYNKHGNGTGSYSDSTGTIALNTWVHIACIRASTTSCKLFINGVLDYEETALRSTPLTMQEEVIGATADTSPSNYFGGNLMNVGFSQSALTDGDILNHYNGDASGFQTNHPLNHASGTTAYNTLGNTEHGTLMNGAAFAVDNTLPHEADVFNNEGGSVRTYFDGSNDWVAVSNPSWNATYNVKFKFVLFSDSALQYIADFRGGGGGSGYLYYDNATGNIISALGVHLAGVVKGIQYQVDLDLPINTIGEIRFGARHDGIFDTTGVISDVIITDAGDVEVMNLRGYGADDWSDTVGNNHGALTGNTDNILIPLDELDKTKDILGNTAQFTGSVFPIVPKKVKSFAAVFDGVNDKIITAHLDGSETVISSGGTSTPTVGVGEITFTAGTCWDLLLSDGTRYTFSEGEGITVHDVSGNANHGIITNATTTPAGTGFWIGRQDNFHWNSDMGFAFSGTSRIPALADGSGNATDGSGAVSNPAGDNDAETEYEITYIAEGGNSCPASYDRDDDIIPFDYENVDDLQALNPIEATFRRDSSSVKKDRLIVFPETLTGDALALAQKYTT